MPANAMVLSGACISIYGVIFIGSSTAFAAMVSAAIIFQQTSCVIPQAIVLYRGRDKVLPERYFDLGKFGPWINGLAVAWVVFLDVLYCFPTSMPVTAQNMSYVSVVTVGLVGFVVVLWFTTKRGVFVGPRIDFDMLNERRNAALHGGMAVIDAASAEDVSSKEGARQSKGHFETSS
jgi:choline transport protein